MPAPIVEAVDLPVIGRSREGLWRCTRRRGRDHPAGGRRRPGRRLDRGRDRQQGRAAVRSRGRGRARGGRGEGRARALPFPFMLTARAEGFLRGKPDLDDVIKRLQAFEAAGADVLMAPGLPDLAAVKKVCGSLKKPFNFMVGIKGKSFSKAELEAAGVKRISLATSLYRAAMTGLLDAAKEVKDKGTFTYLDRADPDARPECLHEGIAGVPRLAGGGGVLRHRHRRLGARDFRRERLSAGGDRGARLADRRRGVRHHAVLPGQRPGAARRSAAASIAGGRGRCCCWARSRWRWASRPSAR